MLDKTKNYKIDVSTLNTAERTALQEQLFLLGYSWYESGQKVTELDSDTLLLEKDMDITCGSKNDFNHYKYPILTVSDIMPQSEGRTLRDWFAGLAISGMVINVAIVSFDEMSRDAYALADAMIKERNKWTKNY